MAFDVYNFTLLMKLLRRNFLVEAGLGSHFKGGECVVHSPRHALPESCHLAIFIPAPPDICAITECRGGDGRKKKTDKKTAPPHSMMSLDLFVRIPLPSLLPSASLVIVLFGLIGIFFFFEGESLIQPPRHFVKY